MITMDDITFKEDTAGKWVVIKLPAYYTWWNWYRAHEDPDIKLMFIKNQRCNLELFIRFLIETYGQSSKEEI